MPIDPASVGGGVDEGLVITDPATVASEPPPDSFYSHRVQLFPAIWAMWARREIAVALAERDIRASYKQAALGMFWALLSPVLTVVLFTLIFSHIKSFKIPGVPYILYSFVGLMCWGFFAGSVTAGGNSMVGNLTLLQKTSFPRELFPLSQMLEQTLYTGISFIPLTILLIANGFTPKLGTLWVPVFIAVEVLFGIGLMLLMSAVVVYVRDVVQIMALIMSLGLFATPIIWPLSKLRNITWGPFHHFDFRPYYSVFNPLGPVIDNVRRTALQGLPPDWPLLGLAAISASVYFVVGYRLFKRLEVNFADIS